MTKRSAAASTLRVLAVAGAPLFILFALHSAWGAVGTCLLLVATATLSTLIPVAWLRHASAWLLVGLSLLATVELATSARTWTLNGRSMLFSTPPRPFQGFRDAIDGIWRSPSGQRTWTIRDERSSTQTAALTIQFDVALLSGHVGGTWGVSQGNIAVHESDADAADTSLSVRFPTDGDPFLWQRFVSEQPLDGRTFRASVDVRSLAPPPSVAPRSTRGLWLREREPTGSWRYARIDPGPTWRRYVIEWTLPANSPAHTLEVALNDLDGWSLEVRDLHLTELTEAGVRELIPALIPNGLWATATFDSAGRPPVVASGAATDLTRTNERYSLIVPLPAGRADGHLTLTLRTQAGLDVQTRDLRVRTPVGVSAEPSRSVTRARLWFGHPNFLGHGLAALLIVWLTFHVAMRLDLARKTRAFVLIAVTAVGLIGILATNSQSALAAALSACALFTFVKMVRGRLRLPAALALLAMVIVVLLVTREPFANIQPRTHAWAAAWDAMVRFPWKGVNSFAEFLATGAAAQTAHSGVNHAHNAWLQAGARFGLPGFIAACWFTASLARNLWRKAGPWSLVTVLPMALLQLVDFTIAYSWVLVPFGVALASYQALDATRSRSRSPTGRGTRRRSGS